MTYALAVHIATTDTPAAVLDVDILVVGAHKAGSGYELAPAAIALDDRMDGDLRTHLDVLGYHGTLGQTCILPARGACQSPIVAVVGLGAAEGLTADALRRAAAAAVQLASKQERVALALTDALAVDVRSASQAVVEGALLGAYSFDSYRSNASGATTTEILVVAGDADAVTRGEVLANVTCLARDLTNTPARDLPPSELARHAADLAFANGLDVDIWEREQIQAEGLGGLLAVSAGSDAEPRLIKLTYVPDGTSRGHVALVGKGITFDSGGLSIKSADAMATQKTDMSGAADVIAATVAIAQLRCDVTVTTIVACAENMPGASAVKPGDVFTARNGKTVEVLNTDAEGRLILADALSLAVEVDPDVIIDVATLTGACRLALGDFYAGLFCNDDDLAMQLEAASAVAGEHLWRLPLAREYRDLIDSDVADLKNVGRRPAGAIQAALFLSEFAGGFAWAHLDVCGPARSEEDSGYVRKGATGFGTRTLIEFVDAFRPRPARRR